MTARIEERAIRFEPEDTCPPSVALVVGLQGAALIVAPTVLNVAIAIRASGLDDSYLAWSVFAGMVISGLITAGQALRVGRIGAGHVALSWPAAMFIAIMVGTISAAGPATFASLMMVCSVIQVVLAWWLPTLRRIITPTVSGTVTMLVAVSVLPIAFDIIQDLPAGSPVVAGPVIAGVTLLVSVMVMLWTGGRWRLVAPFVSILAGCVAAVPFGVLDGHQIAGANWFGIPRVPSLSIDFTPGREFWALLPSFAILTLVLGIKTISDGVAIQQGSRRRSRAIDFRQIQGMVTVNGIGMFLAGIAVTLPTIVISSLSVSLVNLTGVAARRVGIGVAVVITALALFSKLTALLLSIPGPVMGAYLVLAMGILFVSGFQTIMREGLDTRRVVIVAVATAWDSGSTATPSPGSCLGMIWARCWEVESPLGLWLRL